MNEKSKIACFMHSCTLDVWGTEILEYLVQYLQSHGLLEILDYLFINNIGRAIDVNKFSHISDKIIIINCSADMSVFENCTLRLAHFFAQFNPDYKILYLHTKGVSYQKNHPFVPGIQDWVNFMLYCLVDKHKECLEMMNYVDVVGCDYRDHCQDSNPTHFSGNYWWTTADYLRKLSVHELKDKYDAEFGLLFQNKPIFVNIHKCPYGHCENRYLLPQYKQIVDQRAAGIIDNLKNADTVKILYGVEGKYLDITEICHEKLRVGNVIRIPAGDFERNDLFTDPLPGIMKHIRIGQVTHNYYEGVCLKLSSSQ